MQYDGDAAKRVDVADVELGIDALAEQVHRQVDDVDVARTLAIAEQRALDAIGARHHAELRGGDAAPAVVVWVQAEADLLAVLDVAPEPLDDVAVDVRRVALDRRRQVQHDLAVDRRLDDVHHGLADLDREVGLGAGEALGRVLVAHRGRRDGVLQLAAELGGVDGDVGDALPVEAEHDAALQLGCRVVEVHDRPRRALDALVGALDELGPALHQHLDRDAVGDHVGLDQRADEVEVGLRRGREADLDLLEPHVDEGIEHPQLAGRVHRVDEGLVAVAKVDRAPERGFVDGLVGPRPVVQLEREDAPILLVGHLPGLLRCGRHGGNLSGDWVGSARLETQELETQEPPGPFGRRRFGEHRMECSPT